jgi:hypothetical protein
MPSGFTSTNTSGGRASLTVVFAEIVRKIRPRYFGMENEERAREGPMAVGFLKNRNW